METQSQFSSEKLKHFSRQKEEL